MLSAVRKLNISLLLPVFFFAEPGNVFVKVGIRRLSVWREQEQGLLDRQDVDGIRIEEPENAYVTSAVIGGLASSQPVPIPPLRLPPCIMPSFMRMFKQPQKFDIKDTPSLMYSPSTISSTSQSSVSISVSPLAITSISRYPSSQRPRVMRQHYLRAGHGLHRFSRLILLPAHVRDVPERTKPTRARILSSPYAPAPPSLGLRHVPRPRLPSSHASRSASAPLHSVRSTAHLELSADDADACAPHLAALPSTRSCSLRRRGLSHLALLADTLPYALSVHLLATPACACLIPLALPHLVGVPSVSAPRLAVLVSSPGLAAALAPSRPLRRVTPRIASTLYDGLRPAALFGALVRALKELVLVLAPDVRVRARGRLLGAGLEPLLEGTSDEVSLQALYKQVGSLLPNVQALRTLRLRATLEPRRKTVCRTLRYRHDLR
ncbi:hypothetical protein EDB83DRAFT_2647321 [Lactarius deliciosus]|nr:hypothetical protein EDB83DRAFT_2647321 [Lactarius deliciosus]